MKPLTQKQQDILDFVFSEIQSGNPPPSRVEIAEKFNFLSPNAAQEHLKSIEKKGYIKLNSKARGIKILTKKKTFDEWLSEINESVNHDCGLVDISEFHSWMRKAYNAGISGGVTL
ncbi:hypothetical protein [Pectobacterium carotovorum]|uniref:LexA family protein n=1 Tax=Pectobacterium carotovorum TaxID=554 RepID=UPI003018E0E1